MKILINGIESWGRKPSADLIFGKVIILDCVGWETLGIVELDETVLCIVTIRRMSGASITIECPSPDKAKEINALLSDGVTTGNPVIIQADGCTVHY